MAGKEWGTAGITYKSFVAGEILVADRLVYLKSDGKLWYVTGTTKVPTLKVVEAAAAAGDVVTVAIPFPILTMVAGAGISLGKLVMATTAGKVITAATNDQFVVGQAIEAAGADGVTISVIHFPHVTNTISALQTD